MQDGSAETGRMEAFFVRGSGASFRYADLFGKVKSFFEAYGESAPSHLSG